MSLRDAMMFIGSFLLAYAGLMIVTLLMAS